MPEGVQFCIGLENKPGVLARLSVPLDVQHVISKLRDPGLARRSKLAALLEFAVLSLDPRVHSDLLFPGDRRLHYIMLYRYAALLIRHRRDTASSRA